MKKFGRDIRNVDPDEWKAEILANPNSKLIYQVQDFDDRFRYAIIAKAKPYFATFHIYRGMAEESEKQAFKQMVHSQKTGWVPIVDVKGHGYECIFCNARGDPAVTNLQCPCRRNV